MKVMTFISYSINHNKKPFPHATFAIDGMDGAGKTFKYRYNELADDWACTEFTNKIRDLIGLGYDHHEGDDVEA